MNFSLEKAVVLIAFISFAATFINMMRSPISQNEAIEISQNSKLVHKWLERADDFTIEMHHLNRTQIENVISTWPDRREDYPLDHGVWSIVWYIHHKGTVSAAAIVVSQKIDDITGRITSEGTASLK